MENENKVTTENNEKVENNNENVEVKNENKETVNTETKNENKEEVKTETKTNKEETSVIDTLNKTINTLNTEISDINKTHEKALNKKDKEILALQEKITNLTSNYENEVKSQFKVAEGKEKYFDYLINEERAKEDNKEKSFKDIVSIIKEDENNSHIFSKNSTPGNIPSQLNTNEISKEKYNSLDKKDRFKLLNSGVKLV